MEDANINLAIENIMKVGFFNSGQGGSNPKRIIVNEKHYE
jgi:acyl-CoA reductase-like NAD-dependent aldehyde dehydrogenase